ncbi:MAG: dihydrolipoamide acetyltransferase family protein [candidate division WOR-3 bacterium]
MPFVLKLPEIAESVVEGEILKWLKKEGEFVKKNEPIVEVETQKVTVEIPSPFEGILYKILEKEGSVVEVGKPLAIMIKKGEKVEGEIELSPSSEEKEESIVSPVKNLEKEEIKTPFYVEEKVKLPLEPPYIKGKVLATPSARKLARELGIDLSKIASEKKRIFKKDVLEIKEKLEKEKVKEKFEAEKEVIPLRGLRREIAQRLRESKSKAVHTLHVDEADLTELVKLREKMKELAEKEGVKLTYMPFVIKALVSALKKHPYVNATFDDEKGEIVLHKEYNIGVAVATEQGLIVPVVKNCERKSLLDIAREISLLSEKARKRELNLEDVQGGTFSITNIGSIGGLFSFPVINYPQVAILGFHSIKKRPVINERGEIVIRDMVYLSLSFDHRVIDGAEAALFMKDLIKYLETPELLFLESI